MPISHKHTPYTYNEFVAPIAADDLIGAVKLKQNLYDQGTAAIEAKMHELAGFDIAKEEDRAYANQELKKIYQTMQSGASKDFSNPQVVKSFLDVVKPLERDAIFKNAKDSTIELRKRQKTIADIKTNHPDQYHQANESEYMDDVEEWMTNPNAGATLSRKEYTPWKDVSKEMNDITSKIKEDVRSMNTQTGGLMTDIQIKERTAEKIAEVISTLDPSYTRQIQIDANYQAKNTDDQTKWTALKAQYEKGYSSNLEASKLENVVNSVYNPEKLTNEDFARRADIYRKKLEKLETDVQGNKKALDNAYANYYISNWENNMADIYSYRQEEKKVTRDPLALVNQQLTNALATSKQNHELDLYNKKQEMLLTGEAMIDPATGQIVHDPSYVKNKSGAGVGSGGANALNFFNVNPNKKIITGVDYEIPINKEGFTVPAGNPGFESQGWESDFKGGILPSKEEAKVIEILHTVIDGNSLYTKEEWLDDNDNLKDGVTLHHSVNEKGEHEFTLATTVDDNGKKEEKIISLPGAGMDQFVSAPSTTQPEEWIGVMEMTPYQQEAYNKIKR
tara:strand:+ start:719 stop:2407 length:1689 start_codon:yes stop_codon:yes gene_type:complete